MRKKIKKPVYLGFILSGALNKETIIFIMQEKRKKLCDVCLPKNVVEFKKLLRLVRWGS